MNSFGPLDSIAVFGSVARGDRDRMSDRDVLIVSDDHEARRRVARSLRLRGWSPVCFTSQRLERAAAGTGLFMQHLKLEARILHDRNGTLRNSLNRFSAAPQYDREIAGSCELLGVLEKIPNSTEGRYWALDVLSVGLRTMGVATLANHGIYEFSLKKICDALHRIGILSAGDRERLCGIREYKWRHRNCDLRRPISLKNTLKLVELVSRRFRLGLHVRSIEADEALEAVPTSGEISANWYLRSRLIERALLGLRPRRCADREVTSAKRCLEQIVKEPSQYGWKMKTEWSSLVGRLRSIGADSEIRFSRS